MLFVRLFLLPLVLISFARGQGYGDYLFSHQGFYLSSAKNTTLNGAGFARAGYQTSSSPGAANFCVEKTNVSGFVTGPGTFEMEYKIMETGPSCTAALSQALNCKGTSAIETSILTGTPGNGYCLAGAYDNAAFFSILDNNGVPLLSRAFLFPNSSTNLGRPSVAESISTPNEYYICGKYDTMMYVLKTNSSGSLLWSAFYNSHIINPTGILESPYTGELMVIGHTNPSLSYNKSSEGFILRLNKSNGNIINYKTYGNSGCQGFSSIIVANCKYGGQGFIIGGECDPVTTAGQAWVLKLDANGNYIWSTIFNSPAASAAFPVLDIAERLNGQNYEYYALVNHSSVGMLVLKIDSTGAPGSGANAFVYNVGPGNVSQAIHISYNNSGAQPGITVSGSDHWTPTGFYMVRADFSGQSSCNQTLSVISSTEPGTTLTTVPWINKSGALTLCNNFSVKETAVTSVTVDACNTVTGTRTTNLPEALLNLYPRPASANVVIRYSSQSPGEVQINICDLNGRSIRDIYTAPIEPAGEHTLHVDLTSMDIASGVYLVRCKTGKTVSFAKLVYSN